jgi:hypothetical protein
MCAVRGVVLIILVGLVVVSCGGKDSPASPSGTSSIAAANIVPAPGATLSLPNCQALAMLNFGLGISTTTCPAFSGPLTNNGGGCANHVRGTLIVSNANGQQVGSAAWSYANVVRPGELFVVTGGYIDVPSNMSFNAQPTAVWDSVRCL